MNRKKFLASAIPFATAINLMPAAVIAGDTVASKREAKEGIIPPYLKPGDTIGITSPAGYITQQDVQPALLKLNEWGFQVKIGNTIGKRDFTFGGTDEERTQDLQQMLDDPNIKAILCARGGYGIVRIIDQLHFSKFQNQPKWIIGFSDITVLHNHIHHNTGVATIHSKMCNSFPADWSKAEAIQQDSIDSIRQCLTGETMQYAVPISTSNRMGSATGLLVGGNLKTIESLSGSKSDLHTKNKILFVEDTGEYLYSIDRMFWNLERSGKLAHLKGLVIGGFKIKAEDADESFGKTLEQIVLEKVAAYDYPVCFNFPVGHQKHNMALKCGVKHELIVASNQVTLTEIKT